MYIHTHTHTGRGCQEQACYFLRPCALRLSFFVASAMQLGHAHSSSSAGAGCKLPMPAHTNANGVPDVAGRLMVGLLVVVRKMRRSS